MGIPTLAHGWGACDPSEPKNRRQRASILIEAISGQAMRLLVDCGPDARAQLLTVGAEDLDGVFITHEHADHCHGIDELRAYALKYQKSISIFAAKDILDGLESRFPYLFKGSKSGFYPAFLEAVPVDASGFSLNGHNISIWPQDHVVTTSYGLRIGDIAYSTDWKHLDDQALMALQGVHNWITSCVRHQEHPTHAHFDSVMQTIMQIAPKYAILSHMNHSLDYQALRRDIMAWKADNPDLTSDVEPAYDGMIITAP